MKGYESTCYLLTEQPDLQFTLNGNLSSGTPISYGLTGVQVQQNQDLLCHIFAMVPSWEPGPPPGSPGVWKLRLSEVCKGWRLPLQEGAAWGNTFEYNLSPLPLGRTKEWTGLPLRIPKALTWLQKRVSHGEAATVIAQSRYRLIQGDPAWAAWARLRPFP